VKCPRMDELPPPPAGKTGWPWTTGSREIGTGVDARANLPKISIVSPSFNQGRFLEETIRSVLLQGYPDLEYIVIDGGSSDASADIIRKYEPWLTYWVSEKDGGQCHAINKGFSHATGEVFGWMNSDDYFQPGALAAIASLRAEAPGCVGWAGVCEEVDAEGRHLRMIPAKAGTQEEMSRWVLKEIGFHQPASLFDAGVFKAAGGMDETLTCFNDVSLWLRMRSHGTFTTTERVIAAARIYPEANSHREFEGMAMESIAVCFSLGLRESGLWHLRRYAEGVRRRASTRLSRETVLSSRERDEVLAWFTFRDIARHLLGRVLGRRRQENGGSEED